MDTPWHELSSQAKRTWADYLELPEVAPFRYLSPLVYVQSAILRDVIQDRSSSEYRDHLLLCATKALLRGSPVNFRPEISSGSPHPGFRTLQYFWSCAREMSRDLTSLNQLQTPPARILEGDSRDLSRTLHDDTIDFVVTSPPYPVDKDYTRQARIELVFLSQVANIRDLRRIKHNMLRASTRQIYSKDQDSQLVENVPSVQKVLSKIRSRSSSDGDSSGFVRMYPRLVGEYFGGLYRHLITLEDKLTRGGLCTYVLGDSRSFKQVYIKTPEIFSDLAEKAGYEVLSAKLIRTRRSTTLTKPLREVAVVIRKSLNK